MDWDRVIYNIARIETSPLLVLITSDDFLILEEGSFGGFILRITDKIKEKLNMDAVSDDDLIGYVETFLKQYIPFFVDVTREKVRSDELSDQERRVIEETLNRAPEELRKEFRGAYMHYKRETYELTEVSITVTKVARNRYIVVEPKPRENGKKGRAKIIAVYTGRYRNPKSEYKKFKLKYPENEIVKNQFSYDGESLIIRAIVEQDLPEIPRTRITMTRDVAASTSRAVIINGFLVISRLPSKALLDTSLPEIFKDTKIGKKEIRLVMGYFYNKLGTFARKFYTQILPKYAIDAGFGYIVPKENVSGFLEEVEMLKSEYREYEQQLKDFLLNGKIPEGLDRRSKIDPEYTEIVMEFLRNHGKEDEVREKIENLDIAGRVRIDLLPFSVDMSILEEYVDEKVKSMLEQKLYEIRSEMIENARKQLSKRIRDLAKKIEGLAKKTVTKKKIEDLKKDIESVEKIARDLGVEFKEINVLKELLETPVEEIGMKVLKERTSGRLKALLDSL